MNMSKKCRLLWIYHHGETCTCGSGRGPRYTVLICVGSRNLQALTQSRHSTIRVSDTRTPLSFVDQHAAVNMYPGPVHTTRHTLGIGFARSSKRKRVRFEDEEEFIEKRKSSGVLEHLGDFNEDDKHDDPTKKGCNKRTLYQEISSFKVKNYHIVKKPMDFGTMRAKVVEGMYESFACSWAIWKERNNCVFNNKRDAFLLCFNVWSVYPKTLRHHKVEETMLLILRFLKHKRGSCNKSLVSEFQNAKKPNIQLLYWKLKINPGNYKDSLLRFVKVYGPIAQKVATKILEGLKFKQLSNGNTFTSNIVKTILTPEHISMATTQPTKLNSVDKMLTPTFPFVK
ncbi:hypothetical protein MTR_3g463160 [Medicago truncatula]|uniref:Uncharacterized protein n=1 Tax=Medicago truncatula TaxID=3880 RepID=G7ZYH7_MEDTR|nr:hypothetical protein MTR_3g463160 [Medicago truncatula]